MPTYPYDELTPIVPGAPPQKGGPPGPPGKPPEGVEVWPAGPPPEGEPKPGEGEPKPGEGEPKPGEEGKPKPGEGKPGEGEPKPGEGKPKPGKGKPDRKTLTDTEKVIDESDGTARGVLKKIYDEAKRKTKAMKGKAGAEAGSSINIFKPLMESKINWSKLLKKKVRFFADKVGRKMKADPSYLMYPWKAQAQVGIIAKGSLSQPQKNYIYMIFAFDTSGSIGEDEMQSVVNELNSVAQMFKKGTRGVTGKVFMMEWDTTVHQFEEFTPSKEIKVKGGGGTDAHSIFRYIDGLIQKEKNEKYQIKLGPQDLHTVRTIPGSKYSSAPFLVIFTDGEFTPLNKAALGKVYGISENNIFYILHAGEQDTIYPKKEGNWILYDVPKF